MTHPRIAPAPTAASIAAAKAQAQHELKDTAEINAQLAGHRLGIWRDVQGQDDAEVAYCQRCWDAVTIDVLRDPHLAGPAVSRTCQRPDAFLASQHGADLIGGAR